MKRSLISNIVSAMYILLYLYSSISKIITYNAFKEQLVASPLLLGFGSFIAPAVLGIELLASILLIAPRWRLKGLYVGTGLMVGFTIYVFILSFSKVPVCSCGGIIEQLGIKQHIVFNLILVILGIVAIYCEKQIRREIEDHWRSIGKERAVINYPPLNAD